MSNTKAPFKLPKRRFSKKTLNGLIIVVALLIFVLSQTGERTASELPKQNAETVPKTEKSSDLLELKTRIQSAPEDSLHIAIEHWKHPSGARLLFVPAAELPMINLELIFDAGSARDGGRPGLARLTSSLLGEGTSNLDVDDIAIGFESLGSEFVTASQRDMGVIKLKSLSAPEYFTPSLDLFLEVIGDPSFPDASVNRIRKNMLLSLEQEKASPRRLISKATWAALYPEHPYANHPGGTPEALAKITTADLAAFHQTHYTAANVVIAIVGAIDFNTAKSITERLVGALPSGKALPKLPAVQSPKTLPPIHIDYPSQQTHIRLATLSMARTDPDLIPLKLANEVLGGSFTSELTQVIRHDNGLAYSVYSYATAMRDRGLFLIDLQTQNESAAKALSLTQETLAQFIKKGPTPEALNKAKSHLVASFPLGFSTNSKILGQLGALGFYDLPKDYFDQYIPKISATNATTAREVFNRIAGTENPLIITLGPQAISETPTP